MDSRPTVHPLTFNLFRISLGLVYFHFGFLKFFPDLSPAEMLASQTVMRISGGWLDAHLALQVLAVMECTIGVVFLFGLWTPLALALFLFHMLGTFLPLFVLPELTFKVFPLAPTMEGQYILKNVVFVTAGLALMVPQIQFRWVRFPSRQPQAAGPLNPVTHPNASP